MYKPVIAAIVALVVLPGIASAQFYGIGNEVAGFQPSLGVRAGWFDMGDFDSGLGVGVDLKFNLFGQKWLGGVEWGDGEYSSYGSSSTFSANIYDANLNWITVVPTESYEFYLGAGAGWYRIENSDSEDGLGFQALAGLNFGKKLYADVRYVFGTDFDSDVNVDGLRLSVGLRLK